MSGHGYLCVEKAFLKLTWEHLTGVVCWSSSSEMVGGSVSTAPARARTAREISSFMTKERERERERRALRLGAAGEKWFTERLGPEPKGCNGC